MSTKRYDAFTRLDANSVPVGHYCDEDPGCFHCAAGYPFEFPQSYTLVSDSTLNVLERKAWKRLGEAVVAIQRIDIERKTRIQEE